MPYPAYGSSRKLKQRRPAQAQRRRAIYIRRRTRSCAGLRLRLIRPTGPPAGSNSVGPRKRSAAGRYTSDAVPAVVPDGGINALSGLRVLPQAQTAQARASAALPGDIHQTPYPQLCRMAAKMPYPAYGSSRRLKQRRPAQAQRCRAIYIRRRTRSCAGWRHKCLIRPTGSPAGSNSAGPRKRSAAGRYTSDAVPAVVPDGGINALSGLRVLPQAQTA